MIPDINERVAGGDSGGRGEQWRIHSFSPSLGVLMEQSGYCMQCDQLMKSMNGLLWLDLVHLRKHEMANLYFVSPARKCCEVPRGKSNLQHQLRYRHTAFDGTQ